MRPIIQLDQQLANQIAAGEVVERPASVVKELVENSLDAGASNIDVEIISGGTQLIRVRDNGAGIPKQQLNLALSPHATSKISNLDDLEALHSFGFRGEALASISSVSKFSLTSRTEQQDQGWCAVAEGRSMAVQVTPAAATQGTRIDVAELFYNTPARRRFLRTEKTEFYQIETVLKQVVLANPEVTFSLKHNQRMVKRYKAAYDLKQREQRIAAVCGQEFLRHSVRIDVEHQGLELSGWIGLPNYHRSQTDGQFLFVNQRPVKDKVLTHALRQAFQPLLPEGRVPAYVLFLSLEPQKVDVNVHPTKHEVRFHDVRLVHDFIVQAIEQCLAQGMDLVDNESTGLQQSTEPTAPYHDLKSGLHGSHSGAGSSQSFDSYNQFVAQAYQNNLTEQATNGYLPSDSDLQLLTLVDQKHLLIRLEQQLGLVNIKQLFAFLATKYVQLSEPTAMIFPQLMNITETTDLEALIHFCESKSCYCSKFEEQLKITQAPQELMLEGLSQLLATWFAFANDKALMTNGFLWLIELYQQEPELFSHCTKFMPVSDLHKLFGSAHE